MNVRLYTINLLMNEKHFFNNLKRPNMSQNYLHVPHWQLQNASRMNYR